jgi:hypothetical protein
MIFNGNSIDKMLSTAGIVLKTLGGSWWSTTSWAFSTRGPTQRGQAIWTKL